MRAPSPTDFIVEHPVIGRFVYARRTYGDRAAIRAEFVKFLRAAGAEDGPDLDKDLAAMAGVVAMHRVLCVEAPKGWEDLAAVDLTSFPENEAFIIELYADVKAKEDSFRPANPPSSA